MSEGVEESGGRRVGVFAAYGKSAFKSEAERVAYLFELYQKLTAPLIPTATTKGKRGKKGR